MHVIYTNSDKSETVLGISPELVHTVAVENRVVAEMTKVLGWNFLPLVGFRFIFIFLSYELNPEVQNLTTPKCSYTIIEPSVPIVRICSQVEELVAEWRLW